jgi:hypothetical protein
VTGLAASDTFKQHSAFFCNGQEDVLNLEENSILLLQDATNHSPDAVLYS